MISAQDIMMGRIDMRRIASDRCGKVDMPLAMQRRLSTHISSPAIADRSSADDCGMAHTAIIFELFYLLNIPLFAIWFQHEDLTVRYWEDRHGISWYSRFTKGRCRSE
jgi:hypothetical protein